MVALRGSMRLSAREDSADAVPEAAEIDLCVGISIIYDGESDERMNGLH